MWVRAMRALIRELIETAILALLIFLALQFSVQNFRVQGPSMNPTLGEGQYLLVNKLVYLHFDPRDLSTLLPFFDLSRDTSFFPFQSPRRGEVIVFRFPGDETRDFVKRVIGVPGDTVEIRQGKVFLNEEEVVEPYITYTDSRSMPPRQVLANTYFVLGDNRGASDDSRRWGQVPAENIIGRAWVRYWPLDAWNTLWAFGSR